MKKVRIIISLICMVAVIFSLSLCCYASSYVHYSTYKTGQVKSCINVRTEATTKSDSIGKIPTGTKITLKGYKIRSDKKWYRITYASKAGYVSSNYVSVVDKTPYTIYTPYKTGKTTAQINVRSSASTSSKSLGKLSKNSIVTLKGYKTVSGKTWYRITYKSKAGYISSKYVKKISSYDYEIYTPLKNGVVITNGADVRASASESAGVLGILSRNTPVTVKGCRLSNNGDKWYRITYRGSGAYVSSECIDLVSAYSWTVYTPYQVGTVNSIDAAVRSSASVSAERIAFLDKGEKITLMGYKKDSSGNTWYRMIYDGKAAYVSDNAVSRTDNSTCIYYTPSIALKAGVTGMNVLTSSAAGSVSHGILNEGSYAKSGSYVVSPNGEIWDVVKYDGKTGYVLDSATARASAPSWNPYVPIRECTIAKDSVTIRNKASSSADSIGKCKKGTKFAVGGYYIDSNKTKWYRVTYDKKNGYVRASDVKINGTSSVTWYTPNDTAVAKSGGAKVMKEAASSAYAYARVYQDTRFNIRGYMSNAEGKWYRVTYSGKAAYVKASSLSVTDRLSYTIYTPYKNAKVGKNGANVRTGITSKTKKLGSLDSGINVTVLGYRVNDDGVKWYRITYNGKAAYVSSKTVSITGDAIYVRYTPYRYVKVLGNGGEVQEGIDSSSKTIGKVNESTVLKVYGYKKDEKSNIWYRVCYGGKYGYIKGEAVEKTTKPSYTLYSPVRTGNVTASSGVKAYSKASATSKVLGTIPKGIKVSLRGYIVKSGTKYYRIVYDGKAAYIKASGVKQVDSYSYTLYTENKKGKVTADAAIRKNASSSEEKIGTAKKGETYAVKGYKSSSSGRWYRITRDGKTGYVKASAVELSGTAPYVYYTPQKYGKAKETVNIREKTSVNSTKLGTIKSGDSCNIKGYKYDNTGAKWYRISKNGKYGYVKSKYLKQVSEAEAKDSFEEYLDKQGFPESYKPYLRKLHEAHPKWKFVAQKTGLSWDTVVSAETSNIRRNLYNGPYASWKSMEKGAYDFSKGYYVSFDGAGWVAAYSGLTKYYLDPRNFLNNDYIFMFMDQSFDSATQSVSSVKKVVAGTFLANSFPEASYDSYAECIYYAGKNADMNPNVLAAMIIQEQGSAGRSSLISGNVSGYKGYYNYLNIGAYTTGTMSAVTRGLWWAKGAGTGATSYYRPWNTRAKAIKGGARYYAEGYINNRQNTLYLKKFNVMNGKSNVGLHQYMTNVQGAAGEASLMKNAYSSLNSAAITFAIPVYSGMPSKAVALPSKTGNNNNLLKSLSVSGYGLNTSFTRYTTSYTIHVPSSVRSIKVSASPNNSQAKVSGTGTRSLTSGTNYIKVKCTATSGVTRTYTITVKRT